MAEFLQYLERNKKLIPLKGKVPQWSNWTDKRIKGASKNELTAYPGNIGWVLGEGDLIIDVDPQNGGFESLERLENEIGCRLSRTVTTPSGGFHSYFHWPHELTPALQGYKGIDVISPYSKTRQVVIPGSEIDGRRYEFTSGEFEQHDVPHTLFCRLIPQIDHGDTTIDWGKVNDALEYISPDAEYNEWIAIGMALHSACEGADYGYQVFDEWSRKSDKYKENETRNKWLSFKQDKGIGIGTLFKAAYDGGFAGDSGAEDVNEFSKWIYINDQSAFIHIEKNYLVNQSAFAVNMQQYTPSGKRGGLQDPVRYATANGLLRTADHITYMPTEKGRMIAIGNKTYYNRYNDAATVRADDILTVEGMQAVKIVKNHIGYLFGSDSDIFTNWLAWQVQHTGKKLLWCPLIQSIEGLGKSFFRELLECVIGEEHIGTISPENVKSGFNGWAANVAVNVMEELKLDGHNRYDAVNAIKPVITNNRIQINEKYIKPYVTQNVTNYIILTNHRDALPLTVDDRRYWPVFAPYDSISQFEDAVGMSKDRYFSSLYGAMRGHSPQLRRWLEDYTISDEFKRLVAAPVSRFKHRIIELEMENVEGMKDVLYLLHESPSIWWNADCFASSQLFDAVDEKRGPAKYLKQYEKTKILRKLDYFYFKQMRINGENVRVWTKGNMTDEDIRKSLGLVENTPATIDFADDFSII